MQAGNGYWQEQDTADHLISVFILDRFPFQQEGMRFEDDATAGLIDEWLLREYSALGYSVVRVPV